jgi:polyhydroxybutyrate depolymerase
MTSGGVERRFLVAAPPNYDPGRAYPVVLVFHARDEDGAFIRQELGLETADPDWAVFVYPDGLEREWSDGSVATGWQNGPATSYYGGTEDLEFVRDLIVHLEGELCIQIENLFATGRWWGGEFASVVGCYLGERVDAIVPVHSNTPYFLPLSPDAEPPCVGEVAVWVFHGQGDEMFTLQDGTEQRDFWLGRNGCAPDSAAPLEPSGATADDACVEYACSGPRTRFCAFSASYVRRPPAYYAASVTEFLQYLR